MPDKACHLYHTFGSFLLTFSFLLSSLVVRHFDHICPAPFERLLHIYEKVAYAVAHLPRLRPKLCAATGPAALPEHILKERAAPIPD
jgi:hypothetical protein